MKKTIYRHNYMVWLYADSSDGNKQVVKIGRTFTSRRSVKKIASLHASKAAGNEGTWTRVSRKIRDPHADSDCIRFWDVTTSLHVDSKKRTRVLSSLNEFDFAMMMDSKYSRSRYASASRNPSVIGKRHEAVYRSTTLWQAEPFQVEISADYFWTHAEAEAFSKQPMNLILDGGEHKSYGMDVLRLVTLDAEPIYITAPNGECMSCLNDRDVKVTKLKAASIGKLVTDHTDYEAVNILIEDFKLHPELHTFGSLSCGVELIAKLDA